MISNLKATKGCTDLSGNLEADGHSSEESNQITHVQEPKSSETEGIMPRNDVIGEPLDLSASVQENKRRRSSHSSSELEIPNSRETKGNSEKASAQGRRSRSMVSNQNLRTFVQLELNKYRTEDDKYNGIIRILSDVGFLQFCYMLIKGKPGNMSQGSTRETLDGLSYE